MKTIIYGNWSLIDNSDTRYHIDCIKRAKQFLNEPNIQYQNGNSSHDAAYRALDQHEASLLQYLEIQLNH